MRQLTTLLLLVIGGFLTWRIGESLSSDAISMGLGILFGMLAGVPAALLVLAASRRREYTDDEPQVRKMVENPSTYANQPPVIVLAGMGGMPQQGMMGANGQAPYGLLPGGAQQMYDYSAWTQRPQRPYNIVGEVPETVEKWE